MNVYNNMDGSTGCMHSSKGNQLKFNVDIKQIILDMRVLQNISVQRYLYIAISAAMSVTN